jgi:tetratricopeptide (TPR) repeat protein
MCGTMLVNISCSPLLPSPTQIDVLNRSRSGLGIAVVQHYVSDVPLRQMHSLFNLHWSFYLRRLRLLAIAALSVFIAVAQQMPAGHDMNDMRPITPPEQLPVPVYMTGIGNAHVAITATPEAQVWFDQGLNLLHDFWEYESRKAFEQGVRVDPKCAMCYWGLAKAEEFRGKDLKSFAKQDLEKAAELENNVREPERLYIEAAQAEFASEGKRGNNKQEIALLRELASKLPNDTHARLSLALALEDGYDKNREPRKGEQEAIRMLEAILRDVPNDSAANHYWIHAIEPGNHPERAIHSAALLASLAPTSGHMVHMPGHIYYRVGNYTEAERWFSASMAADEHYMQEQHVGPDDDWNYVHNMMYAIANLMEQGRFGDANALSDHLAAARGQLSASLYIWSARDQISRVSKRLPVALRVGDWDAVLAMLNQANLPKGDHAANLRFLAAELTDYAKGMKALESGDRVAAQEHSTSMDAGLRQMKEMRAALKKSENSKGKRDSTKSPMAPVTPDALPEPILKCLSIQSLELQAGVLAGNRKLRAAKRIFERAAKEETKLGYHEPPFYIRPVAETEAAELLKAKDFKGAEEAYRSALVERPNSGFGLYGLAVVKEASGDNAGAREAYETFLKAWPKADANLPEIAHAQKMLAAPMHTSR